ncbi:E2 [Apodemus sylvaticus papillomavirus 1]|uniref:Regulatory protein E2 n=1 Tax=Apodemus sylvaticus papillomavirus 1 TaxID=1036963 RepID=F8SIM6_9PAPI|nr:E2 [Apodemus sylvaticus papillomavirus 1]AEI00707.1 E2 [Apodemus sylvaticus papillomavirus 1]
MMMNQLGTRFDAVQEQILSLYEKGSDKLEDQITYWGLIRTEGGLEYCARKNGINRLGLHTVPCSMGAESKAKSAIQMQLKLKSLLESQYGTEPWTMQDTSLELYKRTDPSYTFKKHGHNVEVLYDQDEENAVSYMVWGAIYVDDEEGVWHKYASSVDFYGVYYTDCCGNKVYYEHFEEDAERFSEKGTWTVRYKNKTLTSCPDSSSKETPQQQPASSTRKRQRSWEDTTSSSPSPVRGRPSTPGSPRYSTPRGPRGRLGQPQRSEQRESTTDGRGRSQAWPDPKTTWTGSAGPPGPGGPSVTRLLSAAGDPPIILVKGPTNPLKCWRNRLRRRLHRPFTKISTAFSRVEDRDGGGITNLLIASRDVDQRETFLKTVPLPKGCIFHKGVLDGL